ncbi:energy transducer TonB [Acinetobacter sp. S40]|uniref:energy transducer TonB n=1 Tax=unclassified Acinetobacter TaxID=196816 RepID=UPI00190962F4|nr:MULTISPECIES: energy transducer TonB [unclassified Acinetobacter]MBJ9984726.1 energy transducer TonB [Acinetobacter sp. S40]MBK0062491.1 energy transducer TonB [Acinetobacter sp. S55]MBK0066295.1 energy transducer TonB [Acinetobacter sp. S54]
MKSKSLFPVHESILKFTLVLPSKPSFKWLIVTFVMGIHVFVVWIFSHLIEPYTFTASPKIDALKVSFISLSTTNDPSPEQSAKKHIEHPLIPQAVSIESASNVHQKQEITSTSHPRLVTKTASQKIPEKNLSKEPSGKLNPHLQDIASHQLQQNADRLHANIDKQFSPTDMQSMLREDGSESTKNQIKNGGVKAVATQQEYSKAPATQAEPDDIIQVSTVDVLSFGQLNYDDRELQQKNRWVELRLRINAKGQPIDVQLRQSSGINSLDERVMQAARQARFKPHKINGQAKTVVVDFPVQLKLSRDR